jgi:DNA repair protein RadD
MINLLPDQNELYTEARQKIANSCKALLIQSATGSGKTVIAAKIVQGAYYKETPTEFIVPRIQLVDQTAETLRDFDINYSYIASGYPFNQYATVKVVSKDTLLSRLGLYKPPKLAIVDEAHYGGEGLDRIIQEYKKAGTVIIGLSATPWQLSGRGMDHQYDDMVEGKSIKWLIENKRLSAYRAFAPDHIDLSGIKTQAGDYAKGQLDERMKQDRVLVGNAVKHYKSHAMGKLAIAYCVSVEHSQIVAQMFNDAGIVAAHIDGATPKDERRRIIRDFAQRKILVLCNCDLLTFGFDLKSASGIDVTIECMIDLRPTKSLALQMQKNGRVLRYKTEPALIFDHANNIEEHGMPCTDRVWTLEGRERKKSQSEKTIPVRQCPKCHHCHYPLPQCPNCKHVYEIQSREIDEVEGELREIKEAVEKKLKRVEVGRSKTYADLLRIEHERGYKKGWAYLQAKRKNLI